ITVVQSILQGFNAPAILLNDGDDIVRLGTGADIRGLISCKGEFSDTGGFDTLIFNMAVPSDQLEQISLELADKDPAGDSIIINGLTYEWIRCDQIVNNIVGGFTTNVPTLSQWGLIATAGLLGIIGFIVIRRRQITI
ncbi:MAG: IPTL-CTERM sorting domain-containing protein, partial [Thermodesulfobacteriota bacterium]